jgi:Domain of unknown function (DUF4845)
VAGDNNTMNQTAQRATRSGSRSKQRGVTLFGLAFWGIFVGFGAYLLIRGLPTVNEFMTIQKTIDVIAKSNPATVAEARQAFDKQKDLEYAITEVTGKDLQVTKENDRVVLSFAYDKLIPIYGPVYVLIKYEGRSK